MSDSSTFAGAFSDVAERYAAQRPRYPARLFQILGGLAPATHTAWDCGTGNGQAAIGLSAHFEKVYATDISGEQIAQAIPHAHIDYRVAPAENSGLVDNSVDLISIAQALHWFDLPCFYKEVRRVLRRGGLIAAYGYSWFYLSVELDELTNQWLLKPVESYWSPNNRLLWDGYLTIPFPFEPVAAPPLALHLAWNLDELFSYYLTWSSARRKQAKEGDNFIVAARRAFAVAWGDPQHRRHVVMPLAVRLGRVR